MKKIFTFLTILVSSFFFCSSIKADTSSFTYSSDFYSLDISSIRSAWINSSFQGGFNFAISYESGNIYIYKVSVNSIVPVVLSGSNDFHVYWGSQSVYKFQYSSGSFTNLGAISGYYTYYYFDSSHVLSDFIVYYGRKTGTPSILYSGTNFNFTYCTYNFLQVNNNAFETFYKFKSSIPEGACIVDNYPILTSFYNLVITKLAFITEYIYSSYVLLSIFAILIFYFVILLFRRLR